MNSFYKNALYAFVLLALLLQGACAKIPLKDPPTTSTASLHTDWTLRGTGIDIPAEYSVDIDGRTLTFKESENDLPELETGTYPIVIYNTAEHITLQGSNATVSTKDGSVEPLPGWLFTAVTEVSYEIFEKRTVTAAMEQQVRLLEMELTITEGNPERITRVEAQLTGIANNLDIRTRALSGDHLNVQPAFTRTGDKLRANVRLIGITGTQHLSLRILFSDEREMHTGAIDLSELLKGFNSDKHLGTKLTADIHTPIETGMTASITGWKNVETSGGTAW
ncbi:FimB/Mfa2 family fimbrial subunit [Limibacterium fermenti]|uniref:FimB/Mfa2 family fimbrial subunit n=1 Tax=Limibacterium fermenti TaxID=3229863 RepID=UPI003A78EB2C